MPQDTREETHADTTGSKPSAVLNWTLALATLLGTAAVLIYAYVQVLGSAGCSPQTCPHAGPGETGFSLIVRGAPVVSIVAIGLSFFTAQRRFGFVVPLAAWFLLAACFVVLIVTFP